MDNVPEKILGKSDRNHNKYKHGENVFLVQKII